MQNQQSATAYNPTNTTTLVDKASWMGLPPLAIVERLKEEFGDYADPFIYDWTQHAVTDMDTNGKKLSRYNYY